MKYLMHMIMHVITLSQISLLMVANCICLLIRKNTFMLKHMMTKLKSFGEALFAAFNATLYNTDSDTTTF